MVRVGLVLNTFTQGAYNSSFYVFYIRYLNSPNPVTTDMNLLTATIPNVAYTVSDMVANRLRSILPPGSTITQITDGDVHSGAASMFDVLVLFHQEYLTQKEYDNLRNFVEAGGTLVTMDGNLFFAEVAWDGASKVTLVRGHFWVHDLMRNLAYKTVNDGERWKSETASWFGSNSDAGPSMTNFSYLQIGFRNNPFGYPVGKSGAENQYLTNPSDVVILDYGVYGNTLGQIATYWKPEGAGKVVSFSIFTDKIQGSSAFWMFFDMVWKQYALGMPSVTMMPKPMPKPVPMPTPMPTPRPRPRRMPPSPIVTPPMPIMMQPPPPPVIMMVPAQPPPITMSSGPPSTPEKKMVEQAASPTPVMDAPGEGGIDLLTLGAVVIGIGIVTWVIFR